MSIGAANHAHRTTNPLTTLLSAPIQATAKKAAHDADDVPSTKATAPKLATSGPGQVVDRKV